jgi:hypothetical protein
MSMVEFKYLLDVYGADRTRWPAEARAGAATLLACDRAARRLLTHAEALDRVLERAPLVSLAREAALVDRIESVSEHTPRLVIAKTVASGKRSAIVRLPALIRAARADRHFLQAGALLAASLFAGVFLGLFDLSRGAVPVLADTVGINLEIGADSQLTQSASDGVDEDLL